jgi:hypothetical protein
MAVMLQSFLFWQQTITHIGRDAQARSRQSFYKNDYTFAIDLRHDPNDRPIREFLDARGNDLIAGF